MLCAVIVGKCPKLDKAKKSSVQTKGVWPTSYFSSNKLGHVWPKHGRMMFRTLVWLSGCGARFRMRTWRTVYTNRLYVSTKEDFTALLLLFMLFVNHIFSGNQLVPLGRACIVRLNTNKECVYCHMAPHKSIVHRTQVHPSLPLSRNVVPEISNNTVRWWCSYVDNRHWWVDWRFSGFDEDKTDSDSVHRHQYQSINWIQLSDFHASSAPEDGSQWQ